MRRTFALLAIVLAPSRASAGNGETFYMGSDAALLAGAATATTEGASALWYNPARLCEGGTDSVDLSVSAYLLRFGGAPGIVSESANVQSRKYGGGILQAVPTAAAYGQRIFGWDFGYGLFVPNLVFTYPRSLAQSGSSRVAIDGSDELTEYYAGIGFGRKITPELSLGVSVFGYYAEEYESHATGVIGEDGTFAIGAGSSDRQSFGVQIGWGLAYRPRPKVRIGFTVRTPVFEIDTSSQGSTFDAVGNKTSGFAALDIHDGDANRRSGQLAPARASLGFAYDSSARTTVALDFKVRAPLWNEGAKIAKGVVDARIGARSRIGAQTWLGGGLFTDRSAAPARGDITGTALDFYGATVGFEFGTPYRAVDEDNRTGALRLSTAVSLSYAIGFGTVDELAVSNGSRLDANLRSKTTHAHEFTLTLSSSLSSLFGH